MSGLLIVVPSSQDEEKGRGLVLTELGIDKYYCSRSRGTGIRSKRKMKLCDVMV